MDYWSDGRRKGKRRKVKVERRKME